jgi:hypothetical protein
MPANGGKGNIQEKSYSVLGAISQYTPFLTHHANLRFIFPQPLAR